MVPITTASEKKEKKKKMNKRTKGNTEFTTKWRIVGKPVDKPALLG